MPTSRPSWLIPAAFLAMLLSTTGCATQKLVNVGYRRMHLSAPTEIIKAPDGSLAVKTRGTYYNFNREVVRVTPEKYIVGSPTAVQKLVKRGVRNRKGDNIPASYWDMLYTWTNMSFVANREWKLSPRRKSGVASYAKLPTVFREPGAVRIQASSIPVEYESVVYELTFAENDIWSGYRGWSWLVQGVLQLPALAFDLGTSPIQIPFYGIRSLMADPGEPPPPNPWGKIREPFISPYNPPF